MGKKVEVLQKKRLLDDFFEIDEAHVRYERFDGTMSEPVRRLSFERGDSVAALLVNTDTQRIVLVEQFRYPTLKSGEGWVIESVAGLVDRHEDPEQAVRRELIEEVGYQANSVQHILTFYASPGGSSERIILYYVETDDANKVADGGGLAAEHEDIRVVEWTFDAAWSALDTGEIKDAKTLIALMWLRDRTHRQF